MEPQPSCEDYRIAIICALGAESKAIEHILDEIYETRSRPWVQSKTDRNTYTTSRIDRHYVVLAYLPGMGKINAAACVGDLCLTFNSINLAIVAGVCGGSPFIAEGKTNVYLGDVIIGTQVIQGDLGKHNVEGFVTKSILEGNIRLPPAEIRSFLHKIQNQKTLIETNTKHRTTSTLERTKVKVPVAESDQLFDPTYIHKHRLSSSHQQCSICSITPDSRCEESHSLKCGQLGCGSNKPLRDRIDSVLGGFSVHLGPVYTTDSIMRNGVERDRLVMQHNAIAFEMEGAGINEKLPTIIIKGVCDYADSHKNKDWQAYAATTAAATCRVVLSEWPASMTTTHKKRARNLLDDEAGDNLRNACLASLEFSGLQFRENNIKPALPNTCRWILSSPEFCSWLDPTDSYLHHRILWLQGKPGSGKSTILKHLYSSREEFLPDHAHSGYFSHGRGMRLQKTYFGMLRSLLYQLLVQERDLLDLFIRIHNLKYVETLSTREWSSEELADFFMFSIQKRRFPNTFLCIDALDECGEDDARKIANFCRDISDIALQTSCKIFICVSIRYYPNIGLNSCVRLYLEKKHEHVSDIERYIGSRLRFDHEDILIELTRKANHVFLWAVLVVEKLNTAYDRGIDNEGLMQILSDTPEELHQIFEQLLGKSADIPPERAIMIQLVLFAFRTLDAVTLYILVKAYTAPERLKLWPYNRMSTERIQAYIITTSCGLLELGQGSEVLFIHESVRDYLFTVFRPMRSGSATSEDLYSFSHECISLACIKYLAAEFPVEHRLCFPAMFNLFYPHDNLFRHIAAISDRSRKHVVLREFLFALWKSSAYTERRSIDSILCRIAIVMEPGSTHGSPVGNIIDYNNLLSALIEDEKAMSSNRTQPVYSYEFEFFLHLFVHWLGHYKDQFHDHTPAGKITDRFDLAWYRMPQIRFGEDDTETSSSESTRTRIKALLSFDQNSLREALESLPPGLTLLRQRQKDEAYEDVVRIASALRSSLVSLGSQRAK